MCNVWNNIEKKIILSYNNNNKDRKRNIERKIYV